MPPNPRETNSSGNLSLVERLVLLINEDPEQVKKQIFASSYSIDNIDYIIWHRILIFLKEAGKLQEHKIVYTWVMDPALPARDLRARKAIYSSEIILLNAANNPSYASNLAIKELSPHVSALQHDEKYRSEANRLYLGHFSSERESIARPLLQTIAAVVAAPIIAAEVLPLLPLSAKIGLGANAASQLIFNDGDLKEFDFLSFALSPLHPFISIPTTAMFSYKPLSEGEDSGFTMETNVGKIGVNMITGIGAHYLGGIAKNDASDAIGRTLSEIIEPLLGDGSNKLAKIILWGKEDGYFDNTKPLTSEIPGLLTPLNNSSEEFAKISSISSMNRFKIAASRVKPKNSSIAEAVKSTSLAMPKVENVEFIPFSIDGLIQGYQTSRESESSWSGIKAGSDSNTPAGIVWNFNDQQAAGPISESRSWIDSLDIFRQMLNITLKDVADEISPSYE